jgi:hypothetical protein
MVVGHSVMGARKKVFGKARSRPAATLGKCVGTLVVHFSAHARRPRSRARQEFKALPAVKQMFEEHKKAFGAAAAALKSSRIGCSASRAMPLAPCRLAAVLRGGLPGYAPSLAPWQRAAR